MTTRLFLLHALAILIATTCLAQVGSPTDSPGDDSAIRNEILRLEEAGRVRMLKGETNWDDIMADSATMIQWNGSIMMYEKGKALPAMPPPKSFLLSDLLVRVHGDIAVVTGLADLESETPDKKPFAVQMRYMNVWKKFADGWKIITTQSTSIRPPQK